LQIAKALNVAVYSGPEKEIGWFPIELTDAGKNNYFRYLNQDNMPVFHWHGDTFDLPDGAVLQASTKRYPNQAFTYGNHILALQFHPEIRGEHIEKWLIGHAYEIAKTPSVNLHCLREETKPYALRLMQQSQLFLEGWLHEINREPIRLTKCYNATLDNNFCGYK
jgi:GMP synthase (glutamine-hydrolysing)